MVAATVCIGFVSLSVWAHHMFTVGMSSYGNSFFTVTTMIIAVPTGIKIFNWIGTMWGGKIQLKAPMLFCIGFLFQFLIAGLTGIMLGASPFDWQLSRLLFCGRPFSLRHRRRNSFCTLRSLLLLVPEDERSDVHRDPCEMAFLAVLDRLPSDI